MKHDLDNLMQTAFLRVELANSEGDPILSGWLPDAKEAWQEQQAAYRTLLSALQECITNPGAACYSKGPEDRHAYVRRLAAINVTATAAIFKATGELP
jgi:hypothetical protein